MKSFQKFLLAPVALGLASPLAASAADLNIGAVDRYTNGVGEAQVTSVSQFSDVRPTDWAYQALSNLVENYGCVAGYPNGTFKGGQPLTRYEAAALLNSCLDRVTEVTDEIKKLLGEFDKELAVLRGRVDKLESKVGQLEATQFSTTTKLQGDAAFVLGASSFSGASATANSSAAGATVFNYDVRLNLSTSFTGKDLLYTRLRAGNFFNSPFSGSPYNLQALDRAFSANSGTGGLGANGNDVVAIDRLYYRFPLGSEFTALIGPKARNTEFLAVTPSYYSAGLLDVFTLNGAPATYNKATGAAFGLLWKQKVAKGKPFFAASTSYVAPVADNGNPSAGGLLSDGARGSLLTQIGYSAPQWALTAAWRFGQCADTMARRGTQFARQSLDCANTAGNAANNGADAYTNNFALTAAWQPAKGGTLVPSVSLGWGISSISQTGYTVSPAYSNKDSITQTQSWQLGLQWKDAFAKGNAFGLGLGQPTYVTGINTPGRSPNDGNYAFEGWYKFQVSDNISVTPALFYLSRPQGQLTPAGSTNSVFGGLIQTQFRF